MPETLSPLESYFDLLDELIEAGFILANARTEARRTARFTFGQAQQTLAVLDITWSEARTTYRFAIECHANQRHDISFAPATNLRRNPDNTGTIAEERCERCGTVRLRTHLDGQWFAPTRGDRYEHSAEYLMGGRGKLPTLSDYRALFGAIQMMEAATQQARVRKRPTKRRATPS